MRILLLSFALIFQVAFTGTAQELDSLKKLYHQAPVDTMKVRHLLIVANYFRDKDSDSLKYYAKASIRLSQDVQYPFGLANGYELLGISHFFQGNLDSAEWALGMAKPLFESSGKYSKVLNTQYLVGLICFRRHEYDTALIKFEKLVADARTANDPASISKGLLMKGVIYSNTGNPARALDAYYQSLALEDSLGNRSVQSMLLNNIGIIHHEQNELDKAESIYKRSLATTRNEPSRYRANVYNGLATIYKEKFKFDSALRFARASLHDYTVIKEGYQIVTALDQLSKVFFELGQYDSAQFYARKSSFISQQTDNKEVLANNLMTLGKIAFQQGNSQEANQFLQKALDQAIAITNIPLQRDVHAQLANLYEEQKDFEQSVKHLKNFQSLKDSLSNESNTRQLTRLEDEYEFEKEKTALLTEQEKKEAVLEAQVTRQRLHFIIALTIAAAILVIMGIIYQLYRQKADANAELRAQNRVIEAQSETIAHAAAKEKDLLQEKIDLQKRELATMAMQSNEKNGLLQQIKEGLKNMELRSEQKRQAKELERIINSSIQHDQSWDSFLHKFEAIYPAFFERLKKEYNALTLNELKLCGYIKIGMSNTEIVNVTSTATSTIKKNVNRLKKKLNLAAEDSIRDFLFGYG